jgi:hypothetical protein
MLVTYYIDTYGSTRNATPERREFIDMIVSTSPFPRGTVEATTVAQVAAAAKGRFPAEYESSLTFRRLKMAGQNLDNNKTLEENGVTERTVLGVSIRVS